MTMINVKSTIELTTEQVKEALRIYLTTNGITVSSINYIRERYAGMRQDELVGYTLDVELGGNSGQYTIRAPAYPENL